MPFPLFAAAPLASSLGKFFLNPRVIAVILICAVVGFAYYKYSSLQSDLKEANDAIKVFQVNEAVYKSSIQTLENSNKQNQAIIEQMTIEKQQALDAVTSLNESINKQNRSLSSLQKKLSDMKLTVAPTPLTPYLKESIRGIQDSRDEFHGVKKPVPAAPTTSVQAAKGTFVLKEKK